MKPALLCLFLASAWNGCLLAAAGEPVASVESVEGRAYMPGEPRRYDLKPELLVRENSRVFLDDGAVVVLRWINGGARYRLVGPGVSFVVSDAPQGVSGATPELLIP